ncbi:oxidoreductase, partial [Klebsiella pneumoniae]
TYRTRKAHGATPREWQKSLVSRNPVNNLPGGCPAARP